MFGSGGKETRPAAGTGDGGAVAGDRPRPGGRPTPRRHGPGVGVRDTSRLRAAPSLALGGAVFLLGLTVPPPARADDGDLDPSFGDDGTRWISTNGSLIAAAAGVDAQGLLVAAFSHQVLDTDHRWWLFTLSDDDIECSQTLQFNLGGSLDDRLFAMAVGPDDRAVLVGRAATGGSPATAAALARVDLGLCNPDPTFSGDGKLTLTFPLDVELRAVALQPDGKIVAGGVASSGANDDLFVVRLHPDGTLDGSFGANGVATGFNLDPPTQFEQVAGLALQPDGKVVVAGAVAGPGGDLDLGVARLLGGGVAAGSLDLGFGTDGVARVPIDLGGALDDDAGAVALWSGGKVVVAGTAADEGGSQVALAILLPDGSLAPDLGPSGLAVFRYLPTTEINTGRALAIQGDHKILVAGAAGPAALFSNTDFAVARITFAPEPGFDLTFGQGGRTVVPFDLGGWGADSAVALTLGQGGRVSLVGQAQSDGPLVLAAARLENSYIFGDGFESGTTAAWSATVP